MANPEAELLVREYMRLVDAADYGSAAGMFAEEAVNHGMTVDRAMIRDGEITEHRANRDDLGLARQLGLLDGTPLAT